jgi:hypothetical protein
MNCRMSTKDFLRFNRRLSNTICEETITKYCCWMNIKQELRNWTWELNSYHTHCSYTQHHTSIYGYLILSNRNFFFIFKSQNPSCVQEGQFKSDWLVLTSADPGPEVKFCHIFWLKFWEHRRKLWLQILCSSHILSPFRQAPKRLELSNFLHYSMSKTIYFISL